MKLFYTLLLILFPFIIFAQMPTGVSKKIEQLKVEPGNPYIFLINIRDYSQSCHNTEKEELINNFGEGHLNIVAICNYTDLEFPNEIIKLTNEKNAFIFWSGKNTDKAIISEGENIHSTEFVAKQFGQNKESSYSINTKKWKEKITELTKSNQPTEKSKEVLKVLLNNYVLKNLTADKKVDFTGIISLQDFSKTKSIETSYLNDENKKIIVSKINFNEKQLPTSILERNSDETLEFVYNDQFLKEIKKGKKTTTFTYLDDKIIGVNKDGDHKGVTVYWLENGHLLHDFYSISEDYNQENNNYYSHMYMENNCVVTKNDITEIACEKPRNEKSYETSWRLITNQFDRTITTKFLNEGTNQINVYKSENQSDFDLVGKIILNDKKMINDYVIYHKGNEIKVNYKYDFK